MALRDQPYLPLYVQDFLTDEKLNECSAESVGVYIMLMCVMHKSEEYGTILLRQKDKQTGWQISDFARKLVRHLPYSEEVIERALTELLEEGVLNIEGDSLYQKRMVKDGEISEKRSRAGKKGAKAKYTNESAEAKAVACANDFAMAKPMANSEYENEYEYEYENDNEDDSNEGNKTTKKRESLLTKTQETRFSRFWEAYPRKVSKANAEKAWAKINPDDELTEKIISAIGTAKRLDERFRETKFIPYPASWLNSQSWENEFTEGESSESYEHFIPSTGFKLRAI